MLESKGFRYRDKSEAEGFQRQYAATFKKLERKGGSSSSTSIMSSSSAVKVCPETNEWVTKTSKSTGKTYYEITRTKETTWVNPNNRKRGREEEDVGEEGGKKNCC